MSASCIIGNVSTPQSGVLALGTTSHTPSWSSTCAPIGKGPELVRAIASLREPRTTIGGVNLVAGFRPERWREAAPEDAPADAEGFEHDLIGIEGFTDAGDPTRRRALALRGFVRRGLRYGSRRARRARRALCGGRKKPRAGPTTTTENLTGFVDGSENPSLIRSGRGRARSAEGSPGEGGTILLLQRWRHDAVAGDPSVSPSRSRRWDARSRRAWSSLDKAPSSHVARTDQDRFGKVFRRNMPYGTVTEHGTMFVGFSAEQRRLMAMLESMAGLTDGVRDALTIYTQPLTGAYYFVPSTEAISRCTESQYVRRTTTRVRCAGTSHRQERGQRSQRHRRCRRTWCATGWQSRSNLGMGAQRGTRPSRR